MTRVYRDVFDMDTAQNRETRRPNGDRRSAGMAQLLFKESFDAMVLSDDVVCDDSAHQQEQGAPDDVTCPAPVPTPSPAGFGCRLALLRCVRSETEHSRPVYSPLQQLWSTVDTGCAA